jgi:ribosome production factor 2
MAPTDKSKMSRGPSEKQPKASVARYLKSVGPQIVEGAKSALLLKGTRCSEIMGHVLKDIRALKDPDAKLLTKKNDVQLFEDAASIEFLTTKNDCAAFALASSNKKRPDNLILGRTFDGALLDMCEFGISNYKSLQSYGGALKKRVGSKPMFLFTGSAWDNSDTHKKLHNLILDFFRGEPVNSLALKGLDHVISVTAMNDKLFFRTYYVKLKKNPIGGSAPVPLLSSSGPDMDMTVRRTQFAPPDLWKQAMKQPKELSTGKTKNKKTNLFGETIGRLHLDRQDLSSVKGKPNKTLKAAEAAEKAEEKAALERELRGEDDVEKKEFKRDRGYDVDDDGGAGDEDEAPAKNNNGKRRRKGRRYNE